LYHPQIEPEIPQEEIQIRQINDPNARAAKGGFSNGLRIKQFPVVRAGAAFEGCESDGTVPRRDTGCNSKWLVSNSL
jgi:hypothetical protein